MPPVASRTPLPSSDGVADWPRYHHEVTGFTLAYPPDWLLMAEGTDTLTLLPATEQGWEAATPADLARDPAVRMLVGPLIRERLGPASFPDPLTPDALRTWMVNKIAAGEGEEYHETTVGGHLLLLLTEQSESGCERVAYWRPTQLSSLVRLATGCESAYLDTFHVLVQALEEE